MHYGEAGMSSSSSESEDENWSLRAHWVKKASIFKMSTKMASGGRRNQEPFWPWGGMGNFTLHIYVLWNNFPYSHACTENLLWGRVWSLWVIYYIILYIYACVLWFVYLFFVVEKKPNCFQSWKSMKRCWTTRGLPDLRPSWFWWERNGHIMRYPWVKVGWVDSCRLLVLVSVNGGIMRNLLIISHIILKSSVLCI